MEQSRDWGELGPYKVICQRNVSIGMRDGVQLSTDLYLPADAGKPLPGPWPAVMVRTPYDKSGFDEKAGFFASHGYFSVAQDVRGTFASEGEFIPFVNEVEDGHDTLAWVVGHERCDGKVGTYGCSYMAFTQLSIATGNPPGLACMIPFSGAIDTFHHNFYPGGAHQLAFDRWIIYDVWRRFARNDPDDLAAIEAIDFLKFCSEMPWRRGETVLARVPHFEDILFGWVENDTYNEFWKRPGLCFDRYFQGFPDIPILWVSGWYDAYPQCKCEAYRKLSALGRKANQYLLLGPWIHNQMSGNIAGDVDFGPRADISRHGTQLAFFDRWLKGDEDVPIPKVRAFLMGGGSGQRTAEGHLHHGGCWWQGDDWPPHGGNLLPWYLGEGGTLALEAPTVPEATTNYVHDPDDPVPSIAPPFPFPDYVERGPSDQREPVPLLGNCIPGRPLAKRPDVCVFQSQPLEQPLSAFGPFRVRLHVSSDAPDTDFAVKLVDVYPPSKDYPEGYAMGVCEGLLRMRYRESDVELKLMEPGVVYEVEIECFPVANLFATGHRIRLDVASSNFPRYEINRNTGDPRSPERRIAHNSIHHDTLRPSCILLPVLPEH